MATWLALYALGCSGGNTNETNRDIGKRDATTDAREQPEPDADVDAEAALGAEVPEADAAPTPMDASVGLDASAVPEAGSQVDAAQIEDAALLDTALDTDAAATADAHAPEASIEAGATPATAYLRPQDSPFASVDFAWFHLEDFEDHQLNTPGLRSVTGPSTDAAAGVLSSSFGSGLIDSVDADDGKPNDNQCLKLDAYCDAWWGPGALTFAFDTADLGALPTHVGGVWTDGSGEVSFEAFGPDGGSIYKVGPVSEPGIFPDNTVSSSTGEDRFFGAYHPAGISAFTVSNTAGGVEMDHVQYGRAR